MLKIFVLAKTKEMAVAIVFDLQNENRILLSRDVMFEKEASFDKKVQLTIQCQAHFS